MSLTPPEDDERAARLREDARDLEAIIDAANDVIRANEVRIRQLTGENTRLIAENESLRRAGISGDTIEAKNARIAAILRKNPCSRQTMDELIAAEALIPWPKPGRLEKLQEENNALREENVAFQGAFSWKSVSGPMSALDILGLDRYDWKRKAIEAEKQNVKVVTVVQAAREVVVATRDKLPPIESVILKCPEVEAVLRAIVPMAIAVVELDGPPKCRYCGVSLPIYYTCCAKCADERGP